MKVLAGMGCVRSFRAGGVRTSRLGGVQDAWVVLSEEDMGCLVASAAGGCRTELGVRRHLLGGWRAEDLLSCGGVLGRRSGDHP